MGTTKNQPEADSEPDVDSVMSVLNRALNACRQVVKVSLKTLDATPQQQGVAQSLTSPLGGIIHPFTLNLA